MSKVDISYGILNFNPDHEPNATQAFEEAVVSLAENRSDAFSSEVYLIDQGGQGLLVQDLAREHGFHAITLTANVGISRGINLLANIARGQYISLVTSDVVFAKGTDEILIQELEKNPDVYQICPMSSKSSLAHQEAAGPSDQDILRHLVQELTIQFWPRSTFKRVGYFDERWKACYENLDYALRCFIHGGNVAISHKAFCIHKHNMCSKSGAINHAYDGYLSMPDGFNHDTLLDIWRRKWHGLETSWLYKGDISEQARNYLQKYFQSNVFLPYLQEVGY